MNHQRHRSGRTPRPWSLLAGLVALAVAIPVLAVAIPAPALAQDPGASGSPSAEARSTAREAFLDRLTGEWDVATETILGPGQEPVHSEGRAVARRVGVWLVTETTGTTPDGRPVTSLFTLGYDTAAERFGGTWISSMQAHSWEYTGELDESGTVLTLETEGPILGDPTTSAEYREIFEVGDDDRYVVRSLIRGPDGEWFAFARAVHRRGE